MVLVTTAGEMTEAVEEALGTPTEEAVATVVSVIPCGHIMYFCSVHATL